jgi:hypothetical protein
MILQCRATSSGAPITMPSFFPQRQLPSIFFLLSSHAPQVDAAWAAAAAAATAAGGACLCDCRVSKLLQSAWLVHPGHVRHSNCHVRVLSGLRRRGLLRQYVPCASLSLQRNRVERTGAHMHLRSGCAHGCLAVAANTAARHRILMPGRVPASGCLPS